ncbi:MAG: major capsid protein [Gammaproteobacteria bacterium]
MIFTKKNIAKSVHCANQYKDVQMQRNAANSNEAQYKKIIGNAGLIPADVYQDFDRDIVEVMRLDQGDAYLNDLLALSRSTNIGKLVVKNSRASDAGIFQTSMSGQTDIKMDQTETSIDGAIVPITDGGFGRNWREMEAGSTEGYDALIDDNREVGISLRESLADQFLDGHLDKNGNFIVVDGLSWQGMRNDSRVASIDLGAGGVNFDFTDTAQAFTAIEAAFKEVRDIMWLTELCSKELTYYVSNEIASNLERASSESFDSKKILQRLAGLQKVVVLKPTSKLSGNQMMAMPLDGTVQPLVGMGVSTIAMPRPLYNSNHDFVMVAGIGYRVKTDYNSNTCAMYATG